MKLVRCLLEKNVLIAGDIRADWDVEKHGCSMWMEGPVLHISRKGVRFMTTNFAGAWADEDAEAKPAVRKAKTEATTP